MKLFVVSIAAVTLVLASALAKLAKLGKQLMKLKQWNKRKKEKS